MMKATFQSGSSIIEILEEPGSDTVLLTVSKQNRSEDEQQFLLSRAVAHAIGTLLVDCGP